MDVLVVDDEPVLREMIAFTLRQAGYHVTTASHGASALAAWRGKGQQLIVSDFSMPGTTGLDLCRAIRAAGRFPPVYFIMLTGHDHREDLLDGPDVYIMKPFRPTDLVLMVNTGRQFLLDLDARQVPGAGRPIVA